MYTVKFFAGSYIIEHPFYGTHATAYHRRETANVVASRMNAGLVRLNPRLPIHLSSNKPGVYAL